MQRAGVPNMKPHYAGLNLFSSWFALPALFLASTFNTRPGLNKFPEKERELFSNLSRTSTKTHSYTLRRRWRDGCGVDSGLFPSYLSLP